MLRFKKNKASVTKMGGVRVKWCKRGYWQGHELRGLLVKNVDCYIE